MFIEKESGETFDAVVVAHIMYIILYKHIIPSG